jgi:hypothetical protein
MVDISEERAKRECHRKKGSYAFKAGILVKIR